MAVMQDQRNEHRVPLRLEVQWHGYESRTPDITSDVSLGGCYVESLHPVSIGQVVNLGIRLPFSETLPVRCEVRYYHPTIGFGLKFLDLSKFQRACLEGLIAYWDTSRSLRQAA
jgi:hypothetical protein